MIKYLGILLFVSAQGWARPNDEIEPFVVGGKPAPEGAYPFAVSFRRKPDRFYCGGSIISESYLLTAGHCVNRKNDTADPKKIVVGIGSVELAKQKLVEVEKITVHPDYGNSKDFHDIAVVKLKTPLKFSDNVQPINISYKGDISGKRVTAMGWGKTGVDAEISPILLHLNKTVLSEKVCKRKFFPNVDLIGPGDLCMAGLFGEGMCMGDSGSPLLHVDNEINYIVGVMSRAAPCATGYPDIFTRVSYYRDWIEKTMQG